MLGFDGVGRWSDTSLEERGIGSASASASRGTVCSMLGADHAFGFLSFTSERTLLWSF